jgi:hypothetical protein
MREVKHFSAVIISSIERRRFSAHARTILSTTRCRGHMLEFHGFQYLSRIVVVVECWKINSAYPCSNPNVQDYSACEHAIDVGLCPEQNSVQAHMYFRAANIVVSVYTESCCEERLIILSGKVDSRRTGSTAEMIITFTTKRKYVNC